MESQDIEVICFTNCVETELFLNGKSLGIKRLEDYDQSYLIWRVPFEKGGLIAISRDKDGREHQDILRTTGGAAGIKLSCTDEEIAADSLDMTHVELEIVDPDGNLVDSAQDLIHVSIEGPGVVLGLKNGKLEDTTPYAQPCSRAHNGKLLIYLHQPLKKVQ